MREILFRAKMKCCGDWEYGIPIQHGDGDWQMQSGYSNARCLVTIDPETVCQYTGHTDKNGRKIFEGDILSAHLDDKYPEDITFAKIVWDGFSWCTRETEEGAVMDDWDCETYEVVGNIFDNPELIEKQLRI